MRQRYPHRIILVVPVNRVNAVVTWFKNNIGPNSVPDDLGQPLSPTGLIPVTHRLLNGCYTDVQARLILRQLCTLASLTPPTVATWNGWTGRQKISWLATVRNDIFAQYGVWSMLANNGKAWDDVAAVLAGRGLLPVATAPG